MFDGFDFGTPGDGGSSWSDGPRCLGHLIILGVALLLVIAIAKLLG